MDFLPMVGEVIGSSIGLLAIILFGAIFYFQWLIGMAQKGSKRECQKCGITIKRYFPNTRFCFDCFHEVRDKVASLTEKLEQARQQVTAATTTQDKIQGYDLAIEYCRELADLRSRYPRHGVAISGNIPGVLAAAMEEREAIAKKQDNREVEPTPPKAP